MKHPPGHASHSAARPWSRGLLLVGACSLAVTWLAWRSTRSQAERSHQAYFDYRVRDAQQRLERRLEAYEGVLRATRGHFLRGAVTRQDFREFVAALRLAEYHPGIQGVGFAQRVPRAGLAAHVAGVRAEGFVDYDVRPPGERDLYTAIVMLEPFTSRNQRAFGFDMYSEPVRRAAMERALALDDVVASGKVTLVQETTQDVQPGFLLYLPVFEPGTEGARPASGAAAAAPTLRGWVYAPFRVHDFMAGVFGERANDLDIHLYADGSASSATLLYDSHPGPAPDPIARGLYAVRRLDIGSPAWTMTVRPAGGFRDHLDPDHSTAVAAGVLCGSLLLAALAWSLLNSRGHALALAAEREGSYRQLLDQANDGILLLDAEGRIVDANTRASEHFGRSIAELVTLRIYDLYDPEMHPLVEERCRSVAARGAIWFETIHRRKDGSHAPAEVSARLMTVAGKPHALVVVRDISERRRNQEELSRAAHEQEIILATANVGITMVVDQQQIWVNPCMQDMFGYARAEIVGQSLGMYFPDEAAYEAFGREAAVGFARGPCCEAEIELRRKDGTAVWVECNGRAVDRGDRSKGTLWVLIDCTARRQADEVLRQSDARFRHLFESHGAVMLLVDPSDGAIVDANVAAGQFYGYPRGTLCAMNIAQIRGQTPAPTTPNKFLVPHRLASGEVRTVEVDVSSVEFDGRGLLFNIIHDVTERESAQAAIERERQRYLALTNIAQDGIHVLDDHGTLVDANPAFLRMLGQPSEAIGHLNVREWDALIPTDQLAARVRGFMERPGLFRTQHRRTDGTLIDVEVHAGAVELEGRRHVLATSRDITERIGVERELRSKTRQLEELNRLLEERVAAAVGELRAKDQLFIAQSRHAAMGEMLGHIAHQWRQPLNALALVLSNLRDTQRFGEIDGSAVEGAVADGNRIIQKMSSTINDFRDFFHPDKERRVFSALAEVQETAALLGASFRHAGIALDIETASDLSLFGVSNEYTQVLLNLLSNARQAISAARVANGRVTLRLEARDGAGWLTVRDNGGGIPDGVLDKIFEPYFSTTEGGAGIGLYMSRQIVEQSLGGSLRARNIEGGAEFVVISPLAERAAA